MSFCQACPVHSSAPASEPLSHFQFLDALRGIAILAVMLLHFCERGTAAGNPYGHRWIWPIVSHGYLGVQLFFVVSGYCITMAAYRSASRPAPALHFLYRRARRIFPPYWASIALTVLLSAGTIFFARRTWDSVFPLRPLDWLLNLILLQEPFGAPDVQLVYWSLSIEIQFYLIIALCASRIKYAEVALVAVSLVCLVVKGASSIPTTGTVLRYWHEFACGIAAFYWTTQSHRFRLTPWLLMGCVALAAATACWPHSGVVQADGRFHEGIRFLVCLGIGSLLVLFYPHDSAMLRFRTVRTLARVGTISYSLYLTHVLIGTRVFNLGARVTGLDEVWWLVYAALSFASAMLIGSVFFRYCEEPWLGSPLRRPTKELSTVQFQSQS